MARHDRAHGVYWAPGSKGGNRRRKAGLSVSKAFRRGGTSRYAIKKGLRKEAE
jgi:hypothetical protein